MCLIGCYKENSAAFLVTLTPESVWTVRESGLLPTFPMYFLVALKSSPSLTILAFSEDSILAKIDHVECGAGIVALGNSKSNIVDGSKRIQVQSQDNYTKIINSSRVHFYLLYSSLHAHLRTEQNRWFLRNWQIDEHFPALDNEIPKMFRIFSMASVFIRTKTAYYTAQVSLHSSMLRRPRIPSRRNRRKQSPSHVI